MQKESLQDLFNSLFIYDELTGNLVRQKNKRKVGSIDGAGYYTTEIQNKSWKIHRIIYIMFYGDIPEGFWIDHINGIKTDNRIENLRMVTPTQNFLNKIGNIKGTSQYKGVYKSNKRDSWIAEIKFNNKKIYLGTFKTEIEAHTAYITAAKLLHGEYFCKRAEHNIDVSSPSGGESCTLKTDKAVP